MTIRKHTFGGRSLDRYVFDYEVPEGGAGEVPATGEGAERPDYLLPKFETAEAQARAYASAEAEMHRMRADNERREKEFTEALTNLEGLSTPAQAPYNPQQDPTLRALERARDEGDILTETSILMQIQDARMAAMLDERFERLAPTIQQSNGVSRDVALRLAEQEVAPRYPNWGEIAPKVTERLAQGGMLPETGSVETFVAAIDSAARLVEYDRLASDARRQEVDRQEKLSAQTLSGDTVRVPIDTDEKKAEWEKVKAADTGDVPW